MTAPASQYPALPGHWLRHTGLLHHAKLHPHEPSVVGVRITPGATTHTLVRHDVATLTREVHALATFDATATVVADWVGDAVAYAEAHPDHPDARAPTVGLVDGHGNGRLESWTAALSASGLVWSNDLAPIPHEPNDWRALRPSLERSPTGLLAHLAPAETKRPPRLSLRCATNTEHPHWTPLPTFWRPGAVARHPDGDGFVHIDTTSQAGFVHVRFDDGPQRATPLPGHWRDDMRGCFLGWANADEVIVMLNRSPTEYFCCVWRVSASTGEATRLSDRVVGDLWMANAYLAPDGERLVLLGDPLRGGRGPSFLVLDLVRGGVTSFTKLRVDLGWPLIWMTPTVLVIPSGLRSKEALYEGGSIHVWDLEADTLATFPVHKEWNDVVNVIDAREGRLLLRVGRTGWRHFITDVLVPR